MRRLALAIAALALPSCTLPTDQVDLCTWQIERLEYAPANRCARVSVSAGLSLTATADSCGGSRCLLLAPGEAVAILREAWDGADHAIYMDAYPCDDPAPLTCTPDLK